jgi:hypothetical protein
MSALSLFGLAAVTAMLIFYALEDRSSWFVLAFAAACALGSVYGFLQGAWPFGLVEAVWAVRCRLSLAGKDVEGLERSSRRCFANQRSHRRAGRGLGN